MAGLVLAKLGVVPQMIGGPDIYPALEKGTIDGAEWVGPYDDEKLGFNKVAQYYYYPGWWEGGPMLMLFVNEKKWLELPKLYQTALKTACAEANNWMPAKYDAQNPPALRRLVASGTKLRPFPKAIMEACEKAAYEVYDELSAKSAHFKRIYPAWKKFRDEQFLWFRVAESTYDNYAFYSQIGDGRPQQAAGDNSRTDRLGEPVAKHEGQHHTNSGGEPVDLSGHRIFRLHSREPAPLIGARRHGAGRSVVEIGN